MKQASLLCICILLSTTAFSQVKLGGTDTKNEYAILYVYTGPLTADIDVVINNAKIIELKNKLSVQRSDDGDVSYPTRLTLAGISFMEDNGYELVTSLGYGTVTNNIKEYTFRKKKTN